MWCAAAPEFDLLEVYQPPDCHQVENLISCMRHLLDTKQLCIIGGELNCPGIDWAKLVAPCDKDERMILKFAVTNGLS